MAMPIERKNSFHLMLSDDEMALLRLLAERDGLTASDYLRSMLRRLAGASTPMLEAIRVTDLLSSLDLPKIAPSKAEERPAPRAKKKAAK